MSRLEGESTMEYLGRSLEAVGLNDMARRARLGHFDDYFCPEDVDDGMNINRLVTELRRQARVQTSARRAILIGELAEQAVNGEFDGTKEESEAWAESPDGQAVFRELIEGAKRKTEEE